MNKSIKKVLAGVLSIGVLAGLISCSSNKESVNKNFNKDTKEYTQAKENKSNKAKEVNEDELKLIEEVGIQNFEVDGRLEVDSFGTTHYKATITNNSNYVLDNITYKYTYINTDGEKDTTYLSCYDTLLQGDTSPVESSFGSDGMELIRVDYTLMNEDIGEKVHIVYDNKLQKYNFQE